MRSEEFMSTGAAAKYLSETVGHLRPTGGYSRQTVRRLIAAGELTMTWSRPEITRDRNDRPIHGHRRVTRSSVEAYAQRLREASK